MESPLNDPLVAALFREHQEHAPPRLVERAAEVAVPQELDTGSKKVVFLPTKPVIDRMRAIVLECGLIEPRMRTILEAVAEFYNMEPLAILSERRTRSVVTPRHVAMYLCRQMTTQSLPQIGRFFKGRDHTTVMHACQKIEREVERQSRIGDDTSILKLRIAEQIKGAA